MTQDIKHMPSSLHLSTKRRKKTREYFQCCRQPPVHRIISAAGQLAIVNFNWPKFKVPNELKRRWKEIKWKYLRCCAQTIIIGECFNAARNCSCNEARFIPKIYSNNWHLVLWFRSLCSLILPGNWHKRKKKY